MRKQKEIGGGGKGNKRSLVKMSRGGLDYDLFSFSFFLRIFVSHELDFSRKGAAKFLVFIEAQYLRFEMLAYRFDSLSQIIFILLWSEACPN